MNKIYKIYALWVKDPGTPAAMGNQFLDTLDQLGPLGPIMKNWRLLDCVKRIGVPIAKVRPRITKFVEKNVSRDEDGAPDPIDGYYLLARGAEIDSEYGDSRSVTFNINVGSTWYNEAGFEIGEPASLPDLDLVTYPIYAGALKILVSNWACPWAYAWGCLPEFPPLVEGGLTPKVQLPPFDNAWIAYLSAPLCIGLTPPTEILCEATPGGGMILSAVLERLDPGDPEHKRRSELLRKILVDRVGMGDDKHPARMGAY